MMNKNVLIMGGGMAGLSAALELANYGINVFILEKKDVLGGHARQFTCKATDSCAKCNACIIEEKCEQAVSHPKIKIFYESQVQGLVKSKGFSITIAGKNGSEQSLEADAVVIASGFEPFDPRDKPYGYKMFDDVVTTLDLEKMLRHGGDIQRPSDGGQPENIAFIQCVGSRDASLKRLWCSKICCGSALRMARLIKSKHADTKVTFFYIDVQTFSKNFNASYGEIKDEVRMIRAIPGDIIKTSDGKLKIPYFIEGEKGAIEENFDMVILSVGIGPNKELKNILDMVAAQTDAHGFVFTRDQSAETSIEGVFAAGTVKHPKSIAETLSDAGSVAWEVMRYLDYNKA